MSEMGPLVMNPNDEDLYNPTVSDAPASGLTGLPGGVIPRTRRAGSWRCCDRGGGRGPIQPPRHQRQAGGGARRAASPGVRKKPVKGGKYQGWFTDGGGKRKFFTGTRSRSETLKVARRLEDESRQVRLGYRPAPTSTDRNRPFSETPKEVQELARHATLDMSMNVYGRTRVDRLRAAVERVGAIARPRENRVPFVQRMAVGAEREIATLSARKGCDSKVVAPAVGLEPTTCWLTASRSAN